MGHWINSIQDSVYITFLKFLQEKFLQEFKSNYSCRKFNPQWISVTIIFDETNENKIYVLATQVPTFKI